MLVLLGVRQRHDLLRLLFRKLYLYRKLRFLHLLESRELSFRSSQVRLAALAFHLRSMMQTCFLVRQPCLYTIRMMVFLLFRFQYLF
ncbi:Uncharacterised protein [Chlamydia trachomatis]|nr:Uncharacterised protein [Chlamydia trachomatis]